MGWVKMPTDFWDDERVLACSAEAIQLYLRMVCWSQDRWTDGHVSKPLLSHCVPTQRPLRAQQMAHKLATAGLLETTSDGWYIVDYPHWGRMADEGSYQAKRNREKQARFRERKVSNPVTDDPSNRGSNPVSNPVSNRPIDKKSKKTPIRAESAGSAAMESEFEAWYRAYPRKRERRAALAKYLARRRAGVPASDLLVAAERYAAHGHRTARPPELTKHPATFLNNGWEDWVPGGAADQESQAPTYPRNTYEVPK